MTQFEFTQQMGRIERQFGKYGEERAGILWREVKDYSAKWFQGVVDRLIGESRHMPLPADFREDLSRERERLREIEKRQEHKDAKDFFAGTYQSDDVRTIVQTILNKMKLNQSGNVSAKDEENYKHFIKLLENAANSARGG